jgi:hypothetical protein
MVVRAGSTAGGACPEDGRPNIRLVKRPQKCWGRQPWRFSSGRWGRGRSTGGYDSTLFTRLRSLPQRATWFYRTANVVLPPRIEAVLSGNGWEEVSNCSTIRPSVRAQDSKLGRAPRSGMRTVQFAGRYRLERARRSPIWLFFRTLILNSSIRFPNLNCATSHRGFLPRPAQVSDGRSGLRYFGCTSGYGRCAVAGTRSCTRRSSNCTFID